MKRNHNRRSPILRIFSVARITLAAAFASVLACCTQSGSVNHKPDTNAAVTTAPAKLVLVPDNAWFDIPRLPGITIDANASDWSGRGFAVDVLRSSNAHRYPTAQFDARLRLGWDDRGLLLLADVTDPDPHEADSDLDLWNGSSVEVILDHHVDQQAGLAAHIEKWQATLSPGVDPRHPRMRIRLVDDRFKTLRATPMTVTATARKTAAGYVLEALFPWNVLAIQPKPATAFGLLVRVNQPHGTATAQLQFLPRQIHLADAPSPPVTVTADGGYDRVHRVRLSVATTPEKAGKLVEFRTADELLGQAPLALDGRLATAEISLPMPPVNKPSKAVVAWIDGKPAVGVPLANADDVRRAAAKNLDFVATPSVFGQSTLPAVDFYSPLAAEDLLGNYTIKATYYDADYNIVTTATRPGRYGVIAEITPQFGRPFKKFLTLYHAPPAFDLHPVNLKAPVQLPPKFGVDPAVGLEQPTAAGVFMSLEMRASRSRDTTFAAYLAALSEIPPGSLDLPRRLGVEGRDTAWWYGLKKKTGDLVRYKYLVHLPDPKSAPAGTRFPMLLFLHGSGERGNSLNSVKEHGPPKILQNEPGWPYKNKFVFVSPQCPEDQSWNPLLLRDLLDEVAAKYPVDPDRVYLTGLSLGGEGAWDLAEWFPDRFAALVPVAGGGDPADAARIADIPTWVFHGQLDPTVHIENAYQMVQALRDLHARVRFTVYPEYGHNSWEAAYDDPRLYDWLLNQSRRHPAQPRSTLPDTRPAEE